MLYSGTECTKEQVFHQENTIEFTEFDEVDKVNRQIKSIYIW